jgi:hypothetical protein
MAALGFAQYLPSLQSFSGHEIQHLSLDHQYVEHPVVVEHAQAYVDPLEEKFAKLQKSLSSALEIYQEKNGQFPARSIILKSPKVKVERIPISQGPGYPLTYINQSVPVTKEVKKSLPQQVQKPDGTFEIRNVEVTQLEPDYNETAVHIQRIPKGCDLTEYCSPEKAELSHQLLQAIKSAAESAGGAGLDKTLKEAFATATTAVWGAYPKELKATILAGENTATSSAVACTITKK